MFNLIHEIFLLVGYLTNGTEFPMPLSEEEEKSLFERFKQGDITVKNEIISRNLRLVAHISKKYNPHSWDSDDLISIGTIGLIKAVDSFDSRRGSRFATYASRCIDNEILMQIRNRKKSKTEVSLQDPIGVDSEGNEICLIDVLGTNSDMVHDEVESNILIKKLYEIMETVLDERERIIIKLRFGLYCEPKTQREIAVLLGVSRSYISRIETKAVNLLKKAMAVV